MAAKQTKPYIRQLECCVCLDIFRDPRVLPCPKGGHTACKECIEQLICGTSITCPLCRMKHTLPGDGVDGFPPNLVAVGMIDTLCKGCRKTEPETHCTHCNSEVCVPCKVSHLSFEEVTQFMKELWDTIQEAKLKGNITNIQQAEELYKKIDEAAAILFRKLEERTKSLKEEVRRTVEDNSDSLKTWKVEMDKQIAAAQKYLDDTKSKLGDKYSDNITDQELTDIKTWCQKKITAMKSSIQQAPSVPIPILEYDTTAVLSAIEEFGSTQATSGPTMQKRPKWQTKIGSKPAKVVAKVVEIQNEEVIARTFISKANLYTNVRVLTEDQLHGHQGSDLFDPKKAKFKYFQVQKTATLIEFMDAISECLVLPVESIRPWPFSKRTNNTFRPIVVDMQMEINKTVQDLSYNDNPWTVFMETVDPSNGFHKLPIFDKDGDVLLFLKKYDHKTNTISYCGHVYMPITDKIGDFLCPILCERGGFPPNTSLLLFEEVRPNQIEKIKSFDQALEKVCDELMDGDIFVFQKQEPFGPTAPDYFRDIYTIALRRKCTTKADI